MIFIPVEKRYLDSSISMPSIFLSEKIRKEIHNTLGFIPNNIYVSNSAPDYVFICIVDKDKNVFALTDSYYLEDAIEDKN
jgi:hypothetical protein